jgi:hypothetical protein
VTPDEALREAKLAGRFNQFEVSLHCLRRMAERSVTRWDICLALRTATQATHEEAAKWKMTGGSGDDGEFLDVVIVFTGKGLVVSVF